MMTFITWSLPGQFCPFSLTRFRHPQDLPRDRTRALLFLCAVKYDNSFIHKYHASYRLAKEKKKTYQLFSNTQVNKHCHIIPVKEHLHLQNSGLCNLKQTDHTKIGKSVTKMNFSAPSKRGIYMCKFSNRIY